MRKYKLYGIFYDVLIKNNEQIKMDKHQNPGQSCQFTLKQGICIFES
jgi:hypothetical protein